VSQPNAFKFLYGDFGKQGCFSVYLLFSRIKKPPRITSDVETLFSTIGAFAAFAALKTNEKVITWGTPRFWGDSSTVRSELQSDVKTVCPTKRCIFSQKNFLHSSDFHTVPILRGLHCSQDNYLVTLDNRTVM
jgi:hypothetical protein